MNRLWDTPPGGDFVAYLERLTAQAAARQAAARQALADDGDFALPPAPQPAATSDAAQHHGERPPAETPIGPASTAMTPEAPLARLLNPLNQLRQRLEQIQAQQEQRLRRHQPTRRP